MQNTPSVKGLKIVYLITAIFATINAIPILGYVINFLFGIPALIIVGLAITEIILAVKCGQKIWSAILTLVTGILGFFSAILIVFNASSYGASFMYSSYSSYSYNRGPNAFFIIGIILGLIAWAMFIAVTIIQWIRFAQLNKLSKPENNYYQNPQAPQF